MHDEGKKQARNLLEKLAGRIQNGSNVGDLKRMMDDENVLEQLARLIREIEVKAVHECLNAQTSQNESSVGL